MCRAQSTRLKAAAFIPGAGMRRMCAWRPSRALKTSEMGTWRRVIGGSENRRYKERELDWT